MEVSPRARHASTLQRDKTIGATMKDILKRRQRGMYQIQGKELCQEKDKEEGMVTSVQGKKLIPSEIRTPVILRGAANLSMARWDWKSVFYNWAMPLDQIILAFRGTDLTGSNSNLSTGSEGASDDSSKPRLRGNKVMRMGSFAFRATQFFENIGKKSTKPRKHSHSPNSRMTPVSSGDYSDVRTGYLYIFSSFNKRRWGKRWCLVRDNMFECYRTDHSKQFELNFLLRPCVVRRALAETNSELGLMIMEGGREKITVEPLSKEDMKFWVRTLLAETSTPSVPEGLEDYLKDPVLEADAASLLSFTVLKQWDMMPSKETLSSTEYEDPMDTTLTAKQFHSAMGVADSKSEENLNCAENVCTTEQAEVKQDGETENPKLGENLASYNKNKHTTDSGFYSVKGVNSDSDSGCENSTREAEEMDCGYATLNSRSFRNAELSSKGNLVIKTPILSPLEDKKTSNTCNTPSSEEHCTNACVDHNSNNCLSQHSESTHQQAHVVKISTPQVSSSVASLMDSLSYLKRPTGFSLKQSSSFTYASSQRVLSPSGEEYSVVVKRSTKSASPEPTSVVKSDHRTTSPVLDIASLANNNNDSQTIEVCLSEEQIPLVPTTPVPELAEVSLNEGILPSPRTSPQRSLTPIASSSPTAPSDISLSPTPYNNSSINNCLEAQEFETPSRTPPQPSERRNLKVSPLALGQSSPSTSCNGQAVTPRSSSLSPVSSIRAESPITPTMENITSLVDNPQTTSEELTSALEKLKDKLSRIKKKRMAVHDKRQRANSDEERLACEKEFAALEKMAESTDLDIRVIQNHLDVLQGQTLEAMKAQRKGKSGSRRKKGKRKP
ncbi:uncharacterized protein LOC131951981 isoform X2 [Physella acuta]|uniref:uncharacterized protein LOC131951981 isoform X2 n=1 Tax=Physella acuta TaxID=109671 RepID=UPI0027DB33F6|nr:uncharacterized protein LOC131951981 isoform X2 [Physella acuta]